MAAPACWTCRLRRKKCDRVRPACTSCADLSIDCHYSAVRPDWMDGGRKQSDMAESIKAQVRQGAAARREREFAVQVLPLGDNSTKQASAQVSASSPVSTVSSAAPVHSSSQDETDEFLTSLFLDTVFPFLFPWYQPANLAGGRTWLLAMIKDQKAIRHTTISISAYYFALSLARDASHTLRTPCEQHVWDTLALHMDSSVQIIQQDMKDFNKARLSQPKADIFQQTHLLEAIVQQLIFDTVMAQGADWNMHLTAASALFCDIFETHGVENGRYHLESVLLAMQQKWPMFEGVDLGFSVWTADQAAFQFFAAFLIFADVISSISLRAPPQLQRYHRFLIADDHPHGDQGDQAQMLRMGDYIGCPGWIVVLLGEISVLEMWKLGGLNNIMEEEVRNQEIRLRARLQEGLAGTDPTAKPQGHDAAMAWIHAAMLYLSVVEQGWQPSHPTITHHVQSIMGILESTPSLRSIMWPFFIAGCLAGEEQEAIFRDVVSKMGPLQAFGTAREALGLMERIWSLRDDPGRDSWGLSNCFSGQGGHVLLI